MNSFIDILQRAGSAPAAWIVLGLLGVWTAVSLYRLFRCPIVNANARVTQEEARRRIGAKIRHPLSFLVLMLIGMVMAIIGLFDLSKPDQDPTLGFLMLVTGLFLTSTLPVRERIKDAEYKVVTAAGDDAKSAQVLALRREHRQLLAYELGILVLLSVALIVF